MNDESAALFDTRKLIEELHKHMRHNMSLWVQWFTFFVTINYVAFGWFASGGSGSPPQPNRHALTYASSLFVTQCALGIWISLYLLGWLKTSDRALSALYKKLHPHIKEPAFSTSFYRLAVLLGSIALLALICGWIALAIRP